MSNKNDISACSFKTSIGGQALIEGIMMRGPDRQAIVCRRPDGTLVTKVDPIRLVKERYPILGWPLIRGVANFLSSMIMGVQALSWSAEQQPEEAEGEGDKLDAWIAAHFSQETAGKLIIGAAVVLGIAMSVGLFALLPTALAGLLNRLLPLGIFRGLTEGVFRIAIFLAYLWGCSRLQDIRRVWQYHGAEHKSIYCYEHGRELTVENAREESRLHPRCGTSFLFIVVFISVLVFSFIRTEGTLARMGLHLLLLPLLVGVSYEFIKLAGRYDNAFTRAISAPGKALQHLTTAEPDDSMLEVGLEALKLVIPEEKGKDEW
ncbi:MAG: DUF1385 domain-containing protein [Oscillospiraceae bacterium]|nr:DUF1385 domain-containing protein [Oscillospiraceae bacterium]